jgi:uncharacterized protein (DUF885 family)
MTRVYEVCDGYVDAAAALDPFVATDLGIVSDALPALDPDWHDAHRAVVESTRRELALAPVTSDRDRIAKALLDERLATAAEAHDLGEHLRDVRTLDSSMQHVRSVFDLMPLDTDDDWSVVARRLRAVPASLAGWRASRDAGSERGRVAAARQAEVCADQAATWAGLRANAAFFTTLTEHYRGNDATLRAELQRGAALATEAFATTSDYLAHTYLPKATPRDGVGAERYAVAARAHNGIELDLLDTYAWGWHELRRIEERIGEVCAQLLPGESFDAVVAHLDTDPSRSIEGEAALQHWLQQLVDDTISALHGVHFDIPAPLHRCEVMIAPAGGAAAMYYTGPSEDFSRPGRTWYPSTGASHYPTWREVSICYHEAVPGHHLQVGQVRTLADTLSRYQRMLAWVSGHGEGWALYAERLMGEIGFLDDPAHELGMLAAQAMRAVRVVVDIGLHLELTVPADEPELGGQRWHRELALDFVLRRARFPESFMRSEVDRYLGLPGQAISYKVGERVWLEARDAARARHGAAFDLARWHAFALDLGTVGLDTLRDELARF